MKKNRPATLMQVLCRPGDATALRAVLFRETTALGIREHQVQRFALSREIVDIQTCYGIIRGKRVYRPDGIVTISPEYDNCVQAAATYGVTLQEVWLETSSRGREQFPS